MRSASLSRAYSINEGLDLYDRPLGHGTGAVVDVQLLEDVGHLGLHCALADGQESAICLLADPLAISWRTSIADSRC